MCQDAGQRLPGGEPAELDGSCLTSSGVRVSDDAAGYVKNNSLSHSALNMIRLGLEIDVSTTLIGIVWVEVGCQCAQFLEKKCSGGTFTPVSPLSATLPTLKQHFLAGSLMNSCGATWQMTLKSPPTMTLLFFIAVLRCTASFRQVYLR